MEWQNPYKNMHPTLIPKIKPLTVHKKAKYTGQRPEKFTGKGASAWSNKSRGGPGG